MSNSKPIFKTNLTSWISFQDYLKKVDSPLKESAPREIQTRRFFNRDLSWLQFNERVLNEAADLEVPLLERLRYAGIVSSNLDEFFMVRVAEIARLAKIRRPFKFSKEDHPRRLLPQIRDYVLFQKNHQAAVFKEILDGLAKAGIFIYTQFTADPELDEEIKKNLPDIKIIFRTATEPLPPIDSEKIHIYIRFPQSAAILSIENRQDRLLSLSSKEGQIRYALLERWLCSKAKEFFPDKEVIEAFPFKLIRDADLRYQPDNEDSIENQVMEAVERRSKARIVRLEVDAPSYSDGAMSLATSLGLDSVSLYRFNMPLDIRTLAKICNIKSHDHLRYSPIEPHIPDAFGKDDNIFNLIKKKDFLLHHPYDSFDVIVRFLNEAAKDPNVTKIFHTMYRTSVESPVMEALIEGAKRGKKVTAYIEIKARFDEMNNVRWAKELRKAGVKVVNPLGGHKVHSKVTQIIRQEGDREVSYLHLGTGNYHPGTAKQYTDVGLLTDDQTLGEDISLFFTSLEKRERPGGIKELLVAPLNMQERFLQLIREETAIQRQGGKGHIIAKMNSLVDKDTINELYAASQAGVRIELLVRGICCLKPGIQGLSENIRVVSVIDKFLEHSRIYYFRANGQKQIYLSSADWMPRNFYSRYETAFPVKDASLKKFIREVILANSLADNLKAWNLNPDGSYSRVLIQPTGKTVRSQFVFEALAKNRYKDTLLSHRPKKTNPSS